MPRYGASRGAAARLAFTAMALAAAVPLHADNGDGQFAVEGVGQVSCKYFNEARENPASPGYQALIGFVEGYLTAANRYEPVTFDLSPWHNEAALGLILEKHCAANPRESLVGSLQKLVISFRPLRVASFSPLLEVGDGQHKAFVYEAILKRAQAALRQRGLYRGNEDGVYSPAVRDALSRFQKQQGLPGSGIPDPATLWTLLNP